MNSTASHTLPTLVLQHGAWHRKEMWTEMIKELPDINVVTVQNPSSANTHPARLGDLFDDAAAIRAAVERIDGPVVAVSHSYGGAPMSQGLVGLPNVKRLVYLTSFMLDVGESILSTCSIDGNGVTPPDFWGQDHVEDGWYEMLRAEQVFYTDLDDRAAKEATAALGPHSYLSMNQRLTQAAWHTIPSTFILATEDQAIPLWAQEKWAERGAQRVRRIASSHSPFLAKPAETAALIRAELEDAAR